MVDIILLKKNILLMISFSLLACTSNNDSQNSYIDIFNKTNQSGKIALIASSGENYKIQQIVQHGLFWAKKNLYSWQVFNSKNNELIELNNTKKAIQNGAEVLLFNLVKGNYKKSIDYAKNQQKKVILLDNYIENYEVDGVITLDYNDAGLKLSNLIQKEVAKNQNVKFVQKNAFYIIGSRHYPNSIEKYNSFSRAWNEWKNVEVKEGSFNKVLTKSKIFDLLENNNDLNIVVADTPNGIEGVVDIFKEKFQNENLYLKQNKIIAGFGFNSQIKDEMKKGNIFSVVDFDWNQMMEYAFSLSDWFLSKKSKDFKKIKGLIEQRIVRVKSKIIQKGGI